MFLFASPNKVCSLSNFLMKLLQSRGHNLIPVICEHNQSLQLWHPPHPITLVFLRIYARFYADYF